MMQGISRHPTPPHDGSDLSVLKGLTTEIKDFPKEFWQECDKVIHPTEIALVVGLILGCLMTLLAVKIFKKN